MQPTLTDDQREALKSRILANQSTFKGELATLVDQGMDPEEATFLLITEIKAMRKDAFAKVVEERKAGEVRYVLFIVVFLAVLLGPFMHIQSPLWYIITGLISAVCGYFAYKTKPIAGILGAIIFAIAFPLACNFYLEGRESIIKIEIVIPLVMALAPTWLAYYILSKTVYPDEE